MGEAEMMRTQDVVEKLRFATGPEDLDREVVLAAAIKLEALMKLVQVKNDELAHVKRQRNSSWSAGYDSMRKEANETLNKYREVLKQCAEALEDVGAYGSDARTWNDALVAVREVLGD